MGCREPAPAERHGTMDARTFRMFRTLIHHETGIWLRDNKEVMLASRLSRRLRHLSITSFEEYYTYLENFHGGKQELVELINCVTTNKTSFFRESHHFAFLMEQTVRWVGPLQPNSDRSLRIWSAACSTGEEPYSIAISLLDALQAANVSAHCHRLRSPGRRFGQSAATGDQSWEVEVIASDVDTNVIEAGRMAIYDQHNLDSVPDVRLKKYFLRGKGASAGKVRVKQEVASFVEFRRINLIDDNWPISGDLDAIFFRNALIYFKQDIQERFLRRMVALLKPGGYLFLGHSENVPWLYDVVQPLKNTVYQRRAAAQNQGVLSKETK
jgi:chemotaxis protein methyltransferase CheR